MTIGDAFSQNHFFSKGRSLRPACFTYYRASTQRQGNCGLGLETQQTAVVSFLKGDQPQGEYVEVESGKKNQRPQLLAATAAARGGWSAAHCQARPPFPQREFHPNAARLGRGLRLLRHARCEHPYRGPLRGGRWPQTRSFRRAYPMQRRHVHTCFFIRPRASSYGSGYRAKAPLRE
ncbi:recombinase family protein [Hymenobacter bucti]|uniref:recombinase family protein n=1 Tax=Hymenobacter bucti TaxID=1844114 RepID=UPI0036D2DEBD